MGELTWNFDPILVLGYKAHCISSAIDTGGFKIVENANWDRGMSTSLRKGVTETPARSTGFMFFLGDMPLVGPSIIREVLKKAEDGASIAAPVFKCRRGFPVYFNRNWAPQLIGNVEGDRGARDLIESNWQDLSPVFTEDRGVTMDVNEERDLARIKSYLDEEGLEIGV